MTSPAICANTGVSGSATTTTIRGPPRTTLPGRCARWAATPKPATWTRTPWARVRRIRGADDSHTLIFATDLASDLRALGEVQAARELDEDTLARKRRVLGEDHPGTLASAGNLAIDLRDLGEHQAARELDEDTLARCRRVLGEDHPDTLRSATNLAADQSTGRDE